MHPATLAKFGQGAAVHSTREGMQRAIRAEKRAAACAGVVAGVACAAAVGAKLNVSGSGDKLPVAVAVAAICVGAVATFFSLQEAVKRRRRARDNKHVRAVFTKMSKNGTVY